MKVLFAPTAKLDLREIGQRIRAENPARAISFINELVDRCLSLAQLPRRYPVVPRYEHSGIRRAIHGEYLIFYRVCPESVDIVHVLRGARDYEAILFPDAKEEGGEGES